MCLHFKNILKMSIAKYVLVMNIFLSCSSNLQLAELDYISPKNEDHTKRWYNWNISILHEIPYDLNRHLVKNWRTNVSKNGKKSVGTNHYMQYWILDHLRPLGCVIFSNFQRIMKYWKVLIFWDSRGLARKWKMLQVSSFGLKHP